MFLLAYVVRLFNLKTVVVFQEVVIFIADSREIISHVPWFFDVARIGAVSPSCTSRPSDFQ